MINNEFQTVGLYEHNADCYKKIKRAYELGEKVVGIVHATGTGKSYNALQLAYDNKDKKIVYVVPSNGIIEHLEKVIEDNPLLNRERDFPNLEFRTYHSFIFLDREEIANIDCDLLILDEFHHIGAPIWGSRINTIVNTHPNMKIFGMTAYTVRDRGTPYERDMANSDTDELFSGKIKSRYDLCDAMIDGVLPKPIYKSTYINLIDWESKLEKRVQKLNASSSEYKEYMAVLLDVKKRIHEAPSIPNILRKHIKPNGKYIYFCPPFSEEETNDIKTIKKQAIEWFKQFIPEEDLIIYTSTSDMGINGKHNRDAFYNDVTLDGKKVDNKLRVMFAINQYNEGIHVPNIDGVIMGRGTASDIVYFEQLGRALSIRGNTKEMFDELEKYSIEQLIEMCKSRDIPVKENDVKEDLIEALIAPVVIDLTNNYAFIKELENNLRDRIKVISANGLGSHRKIKIRNASFDIEIENQNLFKMLKYVGDRLTMTWDDYYELAKTYYEHHGNLLIPQSFKTNDGFTYDENGNVKLGVWISIQRHNFFKLSKEKQQLLKDIGFVSNAYDEKWQQNYELVKAYYEHYGNLLIPYGFKTNDGFTYDENGRIKLGIWINKLRCNFFKLSKERQQLLKDIGFVSNAYDEKWQQNYELAKTYYEHYGNLLIPQNFKTNDGFTYDENGRIKLGIWINKLRCNFFKLSKERQQLLKDIGFVSNAYDEKWQQNYELAKAYYEHYGNLLIPYSFKTNDGFTYDENGRIKLGMWMNSQRYNFSVLSKERQQLLKDIGFVSNAYDEKWQQNYELAKTYYEHYGNLLIPQNFKTNDGFTYDENGRIKLGMWMNSQRCNFSVLSKEKQQLLKDIGFVSNALDEKWQQNYELAKAYYEHYGNLLIPQNFKTNDGFTYDENGRIKLGIWINSQRYNFSVLSKERQQLLKDIGFVSNALDEKWQQNYELAKTYYEHYGNLLIPQNFKTNDGFTYDENGRIKLGMWIISQRCNFSVLSKEKQQLLKDIGFVSNVLYEKWQQNYELAKAYYEHYGNLLIPQNFKTNDGFTYDENGRIKLGIWINSQRKNCNPNSEHGILLCQLGMIWSVKKNKKEIKLICIQHDIDIIKNSIILSHISIQELQSKIEFLKTHNIPILNDHGLLNDIFSMSSIDMKEKYGISLEEVISEYYIKNQKRKGV